MPQVLHLILILLAVVCFGICTTNPGQPVWNKLIAAGLAALALSMVPF